MNSHINFEYTQSADTAREQAIVTEARFFEPYKVELHSMFKNLGREHEWSDDPREMLSYIRQKLIGHEHGNSFDKDHFTDEQEAAARPDIERIGLVQAILPPTGIHVDDVIDLGATARTHYRRSLFLENMMATHGVTTDRITSWSGQRQREARDGTNLELLSSGGSMPGHDISANPWVRNSLERGDWSPDNPWGLTETQLARVVMNKLVDGNLQPHRINLELVDIHNQHQSLRPAIPGVPPRLIESYEFTDSQGQDRVIMNAPAVDRGDGSLPRHVTASCAREWLKLYPPKPYAQVMLNSSNPHTLRTAQDTYQVLQEAGRGDIRLIVAGAGAAPDAPIQLLLGEVGRLIDNDVKRNY